MPFPATPQPQPPARPRAPSTAGPIAAVLGVPHIKQLGFEAKTMSPHPKQVQSAFGSVPAAGPIMVFPSGLPPIMAAALGVPHIKQEFLDAKTLSPQPGHVQSVVTIAGGAGGMYGAMAALGGGAPAGL